LRDELDIQFELVGDGPTKSQVEALAKAHELTNVTFVRWLDKQALVHKAAEADVCLGVFGTTPQSMMTVQNKIYEGLAMGKPVISGDSPVVQRVFEHGEHLYLCERADPCALAAAICTLKVTPGLCQHLAENGYRFFRKRFDLQHNGALYSAHLHQLVEHS
jgi:glycosyltransferase involved in cell wall biosynthesis